MNYKAILNNGNGIRTNKFNDSHLKINQEKKENVLTQLKKGQQVSGLVLSVGEQVTLSINDQEITTSGDVLNNVKPGDRKNFEVVKANGKEIELRVLDETSIANGKPFKATITKNTDWENVLKHKRKNTDLNEKAAEDVQIKSKLDKIHAMLTEQDCELLERKGINIESYTVGGLYDVLKRVKRSETEEKVTLSEKGRNQSLEQRLKENDLPTTSENVQKLSKALELSSSVNAMNDISMQYMIATNASPSVENIYKANYSQASDRLNIKQLTEDTWKELKGQAGDVIASAGYAINEENLNDARWLLENDLPLTKETFGYKKELEDIKKNSNEDSIMNHMIKGMKEGIDPKDVSLSENSTKAENQLVEDIRSISDEAISKAVQDDGKITIRRLKTIQEELNLVKKKTNSIGADNQKGDTPLINEKTTEPISPNNELSREYEDIKAKRQLEEIRLKMTVEAAGQLKKQGIEVDTESLEKVVEELRKLEEGYHQSLLKEADLETSASNVQLLRNTMESVEALSGMPAGILGSTLSIRNVQTIPSLASEGAVLQAEYAKAGAAYETLATVPNAEYGDSIRKAFENANSLLSQKGLEDTEQNKRAIRILGYNQMEITPENVNKVKAYDAQVTSLIKNLNPEITVRMMKQGINPLNITINELNNTIEQLKEEQGITSEDKYSVYLNKLEKQKAITEEERKAYIGIYRLLYNIDKSDGAVLGSVLHSNREVTLSNLLTAIQTNKKGSMNEIIDDEFGTLQDITRNKESISSQLNLFQEGGRDTQHNPSEDAPTPEEQARYLNRIVKELMDEISPVKLRESIRQLNSGLSRSKESTESRTATEKNVWDNIKDLTPEKLLDYLRQSKESGDELEEYASKVKELREMCKNAEQSIRFLREFKMPSTTGNLIMANQLLSGGNSAVKRLLNMEKERKVENSENDIKNLDDLSDNLIDKQTMSEAYDQLEEEAKRAIVRGCSGEQIDSTRLAQLKSIGRQMTFEKALAEKEFYQIPIETQQGITNMNLTILRGEKESGKVSITVASPALGNVKAEFSIKGDTIKGFLGSDQKNGLEQLQSNMNEVEAAITECRLNVKQMDFGLIHQDSENNSFLSSFSEDNEPKITIDTERSLYRIAKAVVQTVRMVEQSNTENRAVS